MELIYNSTTIENIANALNTLQITGIANAKTLTYIMQELGDNRPAESNNRNEAEKNGDSGS